MPKKTRQPQVPQALVEVALMDARSIADVACMSVSQWLQHVSDGEAPPPVIRRPRFTRWRMSDVREFLIKMISEGIDHEAARNLMAQATAASHKAAKKRSCAVT